MKKFLQISPLILLLNFSLLISVFAQQGQWTWMHGDTVPNSGAIYGAQGVPNPNNKPYSLYGPVVWTDNQGIFWLFGGWTFASAWGVLWNFNPAINEWTWIAGPTGPNLDIAEYGTQGVASSTNYPGVRGLGVASWADTSGNLWMLGGRGKDSAGTWGDLNDLWKYNISANEWTWMKGAPVVKQPGIYGTQGVSDPANTPGARVETVATWIDDNNNLWLFGGKGYDEAGTSIDLNDLWKYNTNTNEWTWMKGSKLNYQAGIYGFKGVSDPANTPGGRAAYCTWKDNNGKFWLFGGGTEVGQLNVYNDLWKYDYLINEWVWIHGPNMPNDTNGHYGTLLICDSLNLPPARFENRARWKDSCGNFWMYGGAHTVNNFTFYNAIWKYDVSYNKWVWIDGDSIEDTQGEFGIKGVPNPTNHPPGLIGSVSWSDNLGNLWMFGGLNLTTTTRNYNTLWRYTPELSCSCPICSPFTTPQAGITGDTSICKGDTAVLIAYGGIFYQWSTGDTTDTIYLTPNNDSTLYVVVYYDTCGSDTASVAITINPLPVVDIGNDTSICEGAMILLDAGNLGSSYLWSTGDTSQTITADTTGTYWIIVSACDTTDTAYIAITVNPIPEVNIGNDTSICSGDSVILDAENPGASYNWSTGESSRIIIVDITATYWVIVTNSAGCLAIDFITITVIDSIVAMAVPDTSICEGDNVQLNASGGINYSWSPQAGLSNPNIANPKASPTTTSKYIVTVSDFCGSDTTSVTINVIDPDSCVGTENTFFISNSFTPNGDGDNDILFVRGSGIKNIKLLIYNRWGEKVFESRGLLSKYDIINKGWDGTYRGKPLNTAVFAWYAEVGFSDGDKIYRKGNVMLIK